MNRKKSTTVTLEPIDLALDDYTQIKPGLSPVELMDGVNSRFQRLRSLSVALSQAAHSDDVGLGESDLSDIGLSLWHQANECHTFVTALWEVVSPELYRQAEE
ncbi:hypothetical protein [Endothiovibrio diazotrophicus]